MNNGKALRYTFVRATCSIVYIYIYIYIYIDVNLHVLVYNFGLELSSCITCLKLLTFAGKGEKAGHVPVY